MCIIFCVLPWFSLLFACIFISHFEFQFSFNSFWCPLKQLALSRRVPAKWGRRLRLQLGRRHPLGFPAFRLFSAESWLDIWLMMLTARETETEGREEERKRESQHNGWRWSVGVVINTCLYVSLLQQAHWAPSRWKNKYSIEIKTHWMPHAIVSRWLNYRWAGKIF